jgi:hypothetical protein
MATAPSSGAEIETNDPLNYGLSIGKIREEEL